MIPKNLLNIYFYILSNIRTSGIIIPQRDLLKQHNRGYRKYFAKTDIRGNLAYCFENVT